MVSWSLAQVLLWGYNRYSKDIELWMETESGYDLAFSSTHNQMSGVNPLLAFTDLKVVHQASGVSLAKAKNVIIELNTLKSIWYFRPVLNDVVIDSLELTVRQKDDWTWSLDGLVTPDTQVTTDDSIEINRWVDLLFYQGNIDIRGALVHLYHSDAPFDRAVELDLLVSKLGDHTRVDGEIQGSRNPIDLSFRGEAIHLPGEPDFNFDLFVEVDDLDSLDWTDRIEVSEAYQIDRLATSVRTWINWSYSGLEFVSQTNLADLTVRNQEDGRSLIVSSDELLVSGSFNENYCSINIPESSVLVNNELKTSNAHRVLCDYQGNWWWTTPVLYLEELASVVGWLPESEEVLKNDISTLSPSGILHHPVLWLNTGGEFRLETDVEAISALPWEGAPGATNLTGKLVIEQDQGYLEFDSSSVTLTFPEVFAEGKLFDLAKGRVEWWYDDDVIQVSSDGVSLASPVIDANVGFSFELEMPADEARLGLDVYIERGDSGQIVEYLPIDLEPALLSWTQTALKDTSVTNGRLLFTSTIDPVVPVEDTLLIDTDLKASSFEYDSSWPKLDQVEGHFELTNDELNALLTNGTTLTNPFRNLRVNYPDIWSEDAFQLNVSLASESRFDRYLRFIKQSPLQETIGEALQDWSIEGEGQLGVNFSFDLDTTEVSNIDVVITPQESKVQMPNLPLITDIQGDIHFNDTDQLFIPKLQGKTLNGPVSLTLKSIEDRFHVKGRGNAEIEPLLAWQALPASLNDNLQGNVDYYFDAEISEGGNVDVDVRSDMAGVVSTLPYPMVKEDPKSKLIFVYQGKVSEEVTEHSVDVGALNIDFIQKPKEKIDRTVVSFGRLPKESRVPDQGLFIFARLAQFDIKSWLEIFGGMDSSAESEEVAVYADVAIQKGLLGEQQLDNLSLTSSSSGFGHRVSIRSRQLAGTIKIPKSSDEIIQVDLDYLTLVGSKDDPVTNEFDEKTPVAKAEPYDITRDPLGGLDPSTIPAMDVRIRQLLMDGKDLGVWRGEFKPIEKGTLLTLDDSSALGFDVKGKLWWTLINGHHTTFVDGMLHADDVSDVSKRLGYEPTIRSKSTNFDTYIYWDGSPASFDRLRTQGLVDLSVEDGAFLNVSESANTLKVFGLFNLSSLSRRLKLDFSDVYSSGLAFDEVSAELSVNNEMLDTLSPVSIVGPSSQMSISGTTNLEKETLDLQMRLTVPVSGSLPIAVVVAGVAPVIGGLLLLGQQVWGGMVDQFVGVNYQITGTWDEPNLKVGTQQK